MKPRLRLTGQERREAIIKAARKVFAEKGFRGATTRELGLAAGVSEGLIFKYFPNKEALYSAMQAACVREEDAKSRDQLRAITPSTASLVFFVHTMVLHMSELADRAANDGEREGFTLDSYFAA